jgi:RHS repeat-associated protein
MGNIKNLTRLGSLTAGVAPVVYDNLTIKLNGNQLYNVNDAAAKIYASNATDFKNYKTGTTAQEYSYNANGSMTQDLNRGISKIEYNQIGMPFQVDIKSPVAEARKSYLYTADGKRVKVISRSNPSFSTAPVIGSDVNVAALTSTKYTHYCGNYVFETGVDDKLLTDNGYYSGGKYYFYSKDYLGNIVAVVKVDSVGHSASVVQATHYYPFGLPMAISTGANVQKYKYSGKEFDTEHGLMEYDFGARMYNPQILSTMTMDPHCENYYFTSPYSWCKNNPVNRIDPTGMDDYEVDTITGNLVKKKKNETQDAFYMVAKDAEGNYQRTFTTDADGNKNYNSVSFEYGTVESQRTTELNSTDSYDTYKVRGDTNGTKLFEFMSQNTKVEWSQAKTGVEGDKGLNFLTTSHDIDTERGMKQLYVGQLYAGYTIRELNHNHPSNTAYPSGSYIHPNTGLGVGEWGDVGFARLITTNRKENGLNVPNFNIYIPRSKSYISYGPNSIRSNYGQ